MIIHALVGEIGEVRMACGAGPRSANWNDLRDARFGRRTRDLQQALRDAVTCRPCLSALRREERGES